MASFSVSSACARGAASRIAPAMTRPMALGMIVPPRVILMCSGEAGEEPRGVVALYRAELIGRQFELVDQRRLAERAEGLVRSEEILRGRRDLGERGGGRRGA